MSLYNFNTKRFTSNHPAPLTNGRSGLYCSVCRKPIETAEELEQVTLASVNPDYIGRSVSGELIEFHRDCIDHWEGDENVGFTLIPYAPNLVEVA